MLLLLQNRGRMTSAELAEELEVASRTILRDVDAMTEAGLPIIVHQGNQGGIELGFNYRTRLTGLATDEAEALAVILSRPMPELRVLGLEAAARQARNKLIESFPDKVRETIAQTQSRFCYAAEHPQEPDPRIAAVVAAIRSRKIVRLQARSRQPIEVHPAGLTMVGADWILIDARPDASDWPLAEWADINISAQQYSSKT